VPVASAKLADSEQRLARCLHPLSVEVLSIGFDSLRRDSARREAQMFKRIMLALTFAAAFGVAGIGFTNNANAHRYWGWGRPYRAYYGSYAPRAYYYGPYAPYSYRTSYYGPQFYSPYYYGYNPYGYGYGYPYPSYGYYGPGISVSFGF
jgi:hypothetical protein